MADHFKRVLNPEDSRKIEIGLTHKQQKDGCIRLSFEEAEALVDILQKAIELTKPVSIEKERV